MFNAIMSLFKRVRSVIRMAECISNEDRRFGAAPAYFPAYVITDDGQKKRALFTESQIEVAIRRSEESALDWS